MRTITKEDLNKYRNTKLTVGQLKNFLNRHPEIEDDALIFVERVEDAYFESDEDNGWRIFLKEGHIFESYRTNNIRMLEEINRRNNGEHPKYSVDDPIKYIIELSDDLKDQYIIAENCIIYKDDKELYIRVHY